MTWDNIIIIPKITRAICVTSLRWHWHQRLIASIPVKYKQEWKILMKSTIIHPKQWTIPRNVCIFLCVCLNFTWVSKTDRCTLFNLLFYIIDIKAYLWTTGCLMYIWNHIQNNNEMTDIFLNIFCSLICGDSSVSITLWSQDVVEFILTMYMMMVCALSSACFMSRYRMLYRMKYLFYCSIITVTS